MPTTVNPELMDRIRRHGAFEIGACFQCGNCTAVCPLARESGQFPRRLIRMAQVGLERPLLASEDLWMCYACGECTETCPRQADPAAFMSAARRYATVHYDPTGLARLLGGPPWVQILVWLLMSALFTLLLLAHKGGMDGRQLALFQFIPGRWIHDLGVGLFAAVGLAALGGVLRMALLFRAARPGALPAWRDLPAAAIHAVGESLGQMRYRRCDADKSAQPWHLRPWFVHATIMWGFLGLLAATTLDFLLKPIGSSVAPWSPIRLLGTLSSLVCLYGLAVTIGRRLRPIGAPWRASRFTDWFFLLLLTATVVTGLALELAVYLPRPVPASYILFLVHVVLAMDLIALLPLTKFAHALYRPLALMLAHVARAPQATAEASEAA